MISGVIPKRFLFHQILRMAVLSLGLISFIAWFSREYIIEQTDHNLQQRIELLSQDIRADTINYEEHPDLKQAHAHLLRRVTNIMGGVAAVIQEDQSQLSSFTDIHFRLDDQQVKTAVFSGRPYHGPTTVNGTGYMSVFTPLINDHGKVVGILFTGTSMDSLSHEIFTVWSKGCGSSLVLAIVLITAFHLLTRQRYTIPMRQLWSRIEDMARSDYTHPIPFQQHPSHIGYTARLLEQLRQTLLRNETIELEKIRADLEMKILHDRISAAINVFDDGLAVYDENEKLLIRNNNYIYSHDFSGIHIQRGDLFSDIIRQAYRQKIFITDDDEETFVENRLKSFREASGSTDLLLRNGHCFRTTERKMPDGGRVALRTDITSLKRTEEDLRLALELAKSANHAKTAFLSSMSHDLRTPLNAILGFAQILDAGDDDSLSPRQKMSVTHILRAGQILLGLIEDILDFSRIEAGRIDLTPKTTNVCALMRECVEIIGDQAQKRDLVVSTTPPPEGPIHAVVDPLRMRQILLNLLSNGVKYNRHGGSLKVCGEYLDERWARLSVHDDGPGIPIDLQSRVFAPFDRLGMEASGIEGTGIGLTIARQLTELMGGRIGFESSPREGTTFWIDLPYLKNQPDAQNCTPVELHKSRVVYIEDNPLSHKVLASLGIAGASAELSCQSTLRDGLKHIEDNGADIVFADLSAEDDQGQIDGPAFLSALRQGHGAQCRLFLLADRPQSIDDDTRKAFAIEECLTKPISISRVRTIIREIISTL